MSDTPTRLAEACERAAATVDRYDPRYPEAVIPDVLTLRALAAALRGAKPYDFDTQHRDDQFILTIGDV